MADSSRESVAEREASLVWRALGRYEHKNEASNKSGVPDRFYAMPGLAFFCEWKAEGKPLDGQQERRIKEMRDNGVLVLAPCHSRAQFWRWVRANAPKV